MGTVYEAVYFYITTQRYGLTVGGCTPIYMDDGLGNITRPTFHYRTCPASGLDGCVRFDFADLLRFAAPDAIQRPVTMDDFGLALTFVDMDATSSYTSASQTCAFVGAAVGVAAGTTCAARPYDVATASSTPEPTTLALLGPAMLRIAAFSRRRQS